MGGEDADDVLDIQFFQESMEEKLPEVVFNRGSKSTGTGFLRKSSSAFLVFAPYKLFIISDGIRDFIGDEVLHIAKGHDIFGAGLFHLLVPVGVIHLQIESFFLFFLS